MVFVCRVPFICSESHRTVHSEYFNLHLFDASFSGLKNYLEEFIHALLHTLKSLDAAAVNICSLSSWQRYQSQKSNLGILASRFGNMEARVCRVAQYLVFV